MLLVLDVGNTNTVIGLYGLWAQREVAATAGAPLGAPRRGGEGGASGELRHTFRISTNRLATGDEVGELMLSLVERKGVKPSDIEGSVLASVVPPLNRIFIDAIDKAFGKPPIVVGPGTKTGMPILVDNPVEVGADRIVNAVAAWTRHKQALIVVDFGTGTNFDVVTATGEYVGGAIAPGLDISMDALFSRAAKLPRVELKRPPKAIGKNTIHALQSGLLYGYAGLVDALVDRMKLELEGDVKVLATGGLAFLFEGVSRTIQVFDEFLTLDGLRTIWILNHLNHKK